MLDVADGADGARRPQRIVLGCSFDHRVVEATYVARFLERVAELLGGLDVDSGAMMLRVRLLGRVGYREALDLQRALQRAR